MNNLFIHELKNNYKISVLFLVSAIVVISLFTLIYPSFLTQSNEFNTLLSNYPQTFLEAMGINIDVFTSPIGFYSFASLYVNISLSIYASLIGLKLFSFEKTIKMSDYLFVKPVKKTNIFISKYISGVLLITLVFIIYLLNAFVIFSFSVDNLINVFDFIVVNMVIYCCMLFIFHISIFIGTILPKVKSVSAYAVTIVFSFYFVAVMGNLLNIENIKFITPFSLFNSMEVIQNGLSFVQIIYLLIVIMVIFIISMYIYIKNK